MITIVISKNALFSWRTLRDRSADGLERTFRLVTLKKLNNTVYVYLLLRKRKNHQRGGGECECRVQWRESYKRVNGLEVQDDGSAAATLACRGGSARLFETRGCRGIGVSSCQAQATGFVTSASTTAAAGNQQQWESSGKPADTNR